MFAVILFYDVIDYIRQTTLCWVTNYPSNLNVLKYMSLLIILIVQNMSHEHGEITIPLPEGQWIFVKNNKIHYTDEQVDKILNICVLLFEPLLVQVFCIIICFSMECR